MREIYLAAAAAIVAGSLAGVPARAEPAPPADGASPAATDAPKPAASGDAAPAQGSEDALETHDGVAASPGAEGPAPQNAAGQTPAEAAAAAAVGATVAAIPPPPPPAATPVIAAAREKLSQPPAKGQNGADRAALAAFYSATPEPPLWVSESGFTSKGAALIAEIRKAEDWGLSASAFDLPASPSAGAAPDVLADAEIAVGLAALRYANHARGGRVDPPSVSRNWDRQPNLPDPRALIAELAKSSDPAQVLLSHQPKHKQFKLLRQALLAARGSKAETKPEPEEKVVEIPAGPNLKPGADHPHVALLRERLQVPAGTAKDTEFDGALADALKAFQREKGLKASGVLTASTRDALNGVKKKEPPTRDSETQRLLVNMERWRWMPADLGAFHVWDNVPEFMMRVVKNDEVVLSEKIIVGKPENATPMFSADMLYVVFHPEWGVPDSIKVKEIWPYLRNSGFDFFGFGGSNPAILERHRLRVVYGGRVINASQVDWSNVDVRRYTFIQSPGPHNVLGVVKFRFPNKHDVYMHDTPQRELFAMERRAESHGCMRVQNPRRLAEIILAEDQGMSKEDVGRLLAGGNNNQIELKTKIPVHVNYFTAVADENGKVRTFGDLYGQDSRLAAALSGRYVPVADAGYSDEGSPLPRQEARAKKRKPKSSGDPLADMVTGLFGN